MGSPLTQARVAFAAGEDTSNDIDLSGYQLRAIFSPAGFKLGKIRVTTAIPGQDPVSLPDTWLDPDEKATLVAITHDFPLWITRFAVEHARDDALELFLVVEHRG